MAPPSRRQTMQRMLNSPMQKTFTFLGFSLIFIIILIMAAIRPTFNKISELRSEIRVKQDVNERLQTKINNLNSLQDLYEEREDDLSVIELYFPADMDYSLIMASLERITGKYGYEMDRLSITQEKTEGRSSRDYSGMERVIVSINVTGARGDYKDLLTHLEGLPVIPNLDYVRVDPEGGTDTSGVIESTISVHIYKTI